MSADKSHLAHAIHDGHSARTELECAFEESGSPDDYRFGFDEYDNSVEIHKVLPEFRLNDAQQALFAEAGFAKVYVNHLDGWETHYSIKDGKCEKPWRVHYHKEMKEGRYIEVEEHIPGWPSDWFETGYVRIAQKS